MTPGAAEPSDADRARTTSLRQGDLLQTSTLPLVTVPATSRHRAELAEAADLRVPVPVAVDLLIPLVAVVSGDCDLMRSIDLEPTVVVAPVLDVPQELHRAARDGTGSSRVFALPSLPPPLTGGRELRRPAIDVRWLYTLEKTVLLSEQVAVIPCPLESPSRDRLRIWLGRRLGRIGFPDDIERHVVEPLVEAILKPRAAVNDVERLRRAAYWYGIRWAEGSPVVSLLIVLDPALRSQAKLDAGAARGAQAAIHRRLEGRTGRYTVVGPAIADADEISLLDALSYRQLFLDPWTDELG